MGIRREEEMEMSDDDSTDNPINKKLRVDESGKMAHTVFLQYQRKLFKLLIVYLLLFSGMLFLH